MNKSQVRLLAAEMANGQIPSGEYRARRRELIDHIVAGTETINRAEPIAHASVAEDDEEKTTLNQRSKSDTSPTTPAKRFALPLPMLLVAGAVLSVALLLVLLWPDDAPQPVATLAPPSVPQAEKISPSRALAESFVARRDFSADAIATFSHDWQQIDTAERDRAHSELWFSSLIRALRDEVKTQKALASLAGGHDALERAKAAFALGEFLGVSDRLPRIDNISTASATPAEVPTAAAMRKDPAPPAAIPPDPQGESTVPAQSLTAAVPQLGATTLTGRQWLAAQEDGRLTLQIFAVNNLDQVEQLITTHPSLSVHVLATEGAVPRYRVFHGVFADEASARQAYASLPVGITKASHGAIVKSFSVVRDDLRSQTVPPTAAATSAQSDTDTYALQIFATGNRDSAQALVQAFPALKLQLRELSGDATPYRVVYGDYSSAAQARSAAAVLPQGLLTRIGGAPLPKPVSALGTLTPP
jgi:septal ring-binding cell division protein DamX